MPRPEDETLDQPQEALERVWRPGDEEEHTMADEMAAFKSMFPQLGAALDKHFGR